MSHASSILDIAERRMRQFGYTAVSYRDIAAEIGIKSSSLHYHFPKKQDLGTALVRRYTENFMCSLEERAAAGASPRERIAAFVDIFHEALAKKRLVCLCAVLGAESSGLPQPVREELQAFYKAGVAWLAPCYGEIGNPAPEEQANLVLSMLQGAMIVSSVTDDLSALDAVKRVILEQTESG